ncbi:amidohydrolase family protein [Robertkochia aurantiaca]|uniref:amidohydrolase family protein n=1 Tax=Robertkochia aurantiaca TaxID=2873700 RepID=UPI001CCED6C5|nr:amidohydrolase family protein [Robertkochia sp. 3YJGBD-33]
MQHLPALLISLALFALSSCSSEPEKYDLVITGVHVVDIEEDRILPNQYVAITDNRIQRTAMMDSLVLANDQRMLDGEGRYVMPGLWDNHVHFRGGDSLAGENKALLPLFLYHGVTTVRDAGGDLAPQVISWRNAIAAGKLDGPNIFTPGYKIDGAQPAWPGSLKVTDEASLERALDSLESMEVNFIKTYDGSLTPEMYYATIDAALERGYKTTGHMPLNADLRKAIETGLKGSEHLYYVLKAAADSLKRAENASYKADYLTSLVRHYEEESAREIFRLLAENEVYVTPTLYIGKVLSELADTDHSQDLLLDYIGEGIQQTYSRRLESALRAKEAGNNSREILLEEGFKKMILPMFESGVEILSGSDCGPFNSYVYPGSSLIEEMKMLGECGLLPYQVLATSVINGPAFFELQEFYGSVEKGKVADLILLDANPLEDIANLETLSIVIKGGKVMGENELKTMVEQAKTP